MKKVIALLCAAVLTVGAAVTTFASPSPQVTGIVTNIASATDARGNTVSVSMSSQISSKFSSAASNIKTQSGLKKAMGSDWNANLLVADIKELTIPADAEFPLTIAFDMTGVTERSKVWVLYFNGTTWEKAETTVLNGQVIAVFPEKLDSMLVAFVVDSTTIAGAVSPKTGETNAMVYGAVIAVAAFCGMIVTYSKKKNA